MDLIQKTISNLIAQQFPAFYRDQGPVFVAFVQAYFEWLEQSNNTLWFARQHYEIHDIDETLDQFLIHYKNKYLNHLPLSSTTDTRNLVKHSLDLYRSKGTPRGVDLLFQLVFGEEASIYYPGDDIFILSSGTWVVPMYLEVPISPNNVKFAGKQIRGLFTGAIAFVERVVRRFAGNNKLVDVFYISAINGAFETGETVAATDGSTPINICPPIIGSLTSLNIGIEGSGTGFVIGDVVDIIGPAGIGGKARVTSISDIVGIVSFNLIDGGFGYSSNCQVLISQEVIQITNVTVNSTPRGYCQLFETITQPSAIINYFGATGSFSNGANLYTYFANGSLMGQGTINLTTTINSTAGSVRFVVTSGNMQGTQIFTVSNTVQANVNLVNGYFNTTASGNVMGIGSNLNLFGITTVGTFQVGETVAQLDRAGHIAASGNIQSITVTGANVALFVTNAFGIFYDSNTMIGQTTGATSNLNSYFISLGLINISNTFFNTTGNYIQGPISNTTATITSITTGSGASFLINSNVLNYVETINVNSDLISTYFLTQLSATQFNFPASPTQNLTSANIAVLLSYGVENVGTIELLTNINPGQNYNFAPFIRVYDQLSAGGGGLNESIVITGLVGSFQVGEVVNQSATSSSGLVLAANSSVLTLKRLSTLNNFVNTSNSTTILTGLNSGATANAVIVNFIANSDAVGLNAQIIGQIQTGAGAITGAAVADSGFGYEAGESIFLVDEDNNSVGTGTINLGHLGIGTGYYTDKGGFLSDTKKLYDGIYYQNYSYEIHSPLPLDQYKDIMLQVMHVVGTQMFGAFFHTGVSNSQAGIQSVIAGIQWPGDTLISTANISGPQGAGNLLEAIDTAASGANLLIQAAGSSADAADTLAAHANG